MLSFGTVKRRLSSVMVPITTTVLLLDFSETLATTLERDTGGLLIRDMNKRRRTTLLKEDSVRPNSRLVVAIFEDRELVVLTGQEAVKLHKELNVNVVALWRLAVRAANMVLVKIDTY